MKHDEAYAVLRELAPYPAPGWGEWREVTESPVLISKADWGKSVGQWVALRLIPSEGLVRVAWSNKEGTHYVFVSLADPSSRRLIREATEHSTKVVE